MLILRLLSRHLDLGVRAVFLGASRVRQLAMRVHHLEQCLDVLELFLRRLILVLVELGNLLASYLHEDLLWLLHLEHLSRSAVVDRRYFCAVVHELMSVDHLLRHRTGLLVEGILDELLLEPEVLELLLLFALTLQICRRVHHSQLLYLFSLGLFDGYVAQNALTSHHLLIMPLMLPLDEISSGVRCSPKTFVS